MADNNSEILALLAESLRAADRDREENMHRFERLTEVMANGFDRVEAKISETNVRLDHLTGRVDHLTEAVRELKTEVSALKTEVSELKTDMREVKTDIREIKAQAQETNRRLTNTFGQVGQLIEQTNASDLRLSHVETAQQPSNAELDARPQAVEEQLRKAS
ncbi:MAG: cell division protein ZapB [Bacteroidota bacterium]|nr:cell division protein ZapB [Bacteroidota bacterium]